MERIMWLVLGGIAFVAAHRADRSTRALHVARASLGVLMLVFGAAVNAVYLTTSHDHYADFADNTPIPFVRETWNSLLVPNQVFFVSVLIACEMIAGVLLLSWGRLPQAGLIGLIGFHVGQLVFGWFMWLWAIPMLITFTLLLRAQRRAATATPAAPRSQPPPTPV